ncbi:MAG: pilus assembly protein [Gammaproteobacteria bacterium]|nr:pilus assembly protein [Gammaproteobacteria bacterium]
MVESVIVGSVLLLLVFGALQFALIYHAKITLNYAAFEAARSGSLNNARMNFIENGFVRGLAPLFTHDDTADGVRRARCVVRTELYGGDEYACQAGGDPPPGPVIPAGATNDTWVDIEILNPRPEHFQTSNHGVDVSGGYEIPNDNLMYRPATVKGGVSIQDANLLKIRVTYCYPMYVPLVNNTIATLLRLYAAGLNPQAPEGEWRAQVEDYFAARATGGTLPMPDRCLYAQPNPRIPLNAMAIVRMQSPAFRETP